MFLSSLLAAIRRQRRSFRELSAFDDRMLADVGIRRGEIARVVRDGR